jgi:hypothetical protein
MIKRFHVAVVKLIRLLQISFLWDGLKVPRDMKAGYLVPLQRNYVVNGISCPSGASEFNGKTVLEANLHLVLGGQPCGRSLAETAAADIDQLTV